MYEFAMSLEAQYEVISLEASGGADAVRQAITRLPSFFVSLTARLGQALSAPIDAFFPKHNLEWAAAQCLAVPYHVMRARTMPAVPGLKVDYLTYTNALAQNAALSATVEERMLTPVINYLSQALNNPDQFRNMRPDNQLDGISVTKLNQASKAISRMTEVTSNPATALYGTLIRRNADWQQIIENSQNIHLVFTSADHVRLMSTVERLNTLISTLIQRLNGDQDAYKVAGPVLKKIIDLTYNCGIGVEFFGLTYRRTLVYDNAIERFIAVMKQAS